MMANRRHKCRLMALVCAAAFLSISTAATKLVLAQGTKGGSGSSFSSLNSFSNQVQQQQQQQPQPLNQQLSSSFVQMFNSLTPIEQRQFINQMSSSNKKIFLSATQPAPATSNFFNEEVSSSSQGSGGAPLASAGGTKSAFSRQISSQNILSPVQQQQQQQQAFSKKIVQSSFVQPTVQPTSAFSFSRQVSSSNVQQPAAVQQIITIPQQQQFSEQQFQATKSASVQPQPQREQFFQQIQRVQQVAQPVVQPSSESSFRRVQSFSSQPLPVQQQQQQEAQSGFTQTQFVQQVQPQPTKSSSFSNSRQFISRGQSVSVPVQQSNNFASTFSASSNLAGGQAGANFLANAGDAGGFSGALQQEKLDLNQLVAPNVAQTTSGFDQSQQFVQTSSGQFVPVTTTGGSSSSLFEQQGASSSSSGLNSGGFDAADVQQRSLPSSSTFALDDPNGGLTAASINNKWYIMRPVENPSALGLGDARAASGSLRQLSLPKSGALSAALTATSRSAGTSPSTAAAVAPKKRSTSDKKKNRLSANNSDSGDDEPTDSASGPTGEPSADTRATESSVERAAGASDDETEEGRK